DLLHIGPISSGAWQPPIDVIVSSQLARIDCELAGVAPSDLRVSISGNLLRIAGCRRAPDAQPASAGFGYWSAEIQYGEFERVVELPWLADARGMRVGSQHGLLSVEVRPLRGAAQEKRGVELALEKGREP
ncbi:MAG TPA: Hsp20/alpha crystallin family protein, partial [Polyangiaceae bacterium]